MYIALDCQAAPAYFKLASDRDSTRPIHNDCGESKRLAQVVSYASRYVTSSPYSPAVMDQATVETVILHFWESDEALASCVKRDLLIAEEGLEALLADGRAKNVVFADTL